MENSEGPVDHSKSDLNTFIQRVDKTFPVEPSRLSSLPSEVKLKLGGLLVAHIVDVFWGSVRCENSNETDSFASGLSDWSKNLCETYFSSILHCTETEKSALMKLLEIALPPHTAAPPVSQTTDSVITDLSSIDRYVGVDKGTFIEFLESFPCIAPLLLVVLLRDSVVLLILLSDDVYRIYNARTREVFFAVALSVSLDMDAVRMWEKSIGEILHGSSHVSSSRLSDNERQGLSRKLKIGAGAVGGAVLLGVTGGLAFPLLASVASGFGAAFAGLGLGVLGTVFAATSMVLGSVSVASAVALFGITGGSLVSYKLSNRFGSLNSHDFKFKAIHGIGDPESPSCDALEIVLCVSGYLRSQNDFIIPWESISTSSRGLVDTFALRWERKNLENLGGVFVKLLSAELATALTNAYLQLSLGALASTVALPISILSVMSDLDNILIVCENRAKLAGDALADVICNREFGTRPYTLIAYSVGATAVFSCLQALADAGKYFSIQNVILIGSTIPCTFLYPEQRIPWLKARRVVSGRFINVYSKKDMLLQVLCRYLQWTIQVAGVTEVSCAGVENFDVSDIIASHSDYPAAIRLILERVQYIQ